MKPRKRQWLLGVALGGIGLVALALALHQPLLDLVGEWLVVEERLQHADAIIVLAGGTPSRERMGATLLKEGWAPRIVISRERTPGRVLELIELGIRSLDSQGEARLALERLGVPSDRIIAVPEAARTTESELRIAYQLARAEGFRRVLLVSSAQHTRRVKLIWSREARDTIPGIVVPVRDERFGTDPWWRDRRAAETVLHEYLGIVAIQLGISPLLR